MLSHPAHHPCPCPPGPLQWGSLTSLAAVHTPLSLPVHTYLPSAMALAIFTCIQMGCCAWHSEGALRIFVGWELN